MPRRKRSVEPQIGLEAKCAVMHSALLQRTAVSHENRGKPCRCILQPLPGLPISTKSCQRPVRPEARDAPEAPVTESAEARHLCHGGQAGKCVCFFFALGDDAPPPPELFLPLSPSLHLSSVHSQRPIESTGGGSLAALRARGGRAAAGEAARPQRRRRRGLAATPRLWRPRRPKAPVSKPPRPLSSSLLLSPPLSSLLSLLLLLPRFFFSPPLLFFRSSSCGLSFLVPRWSQLPERRLGFRPRGVLKGSRRAPLLCSAPAPNS